MANQITDDVLYKMDKETTFKNRNLEEIKAWLKSRGIHLSKSEIKEFNENEDLSTTEGTQIRRRLVGRNQEGFQIFAITVVHDGKIILDNKRERFFGPFQDLKDINLSKNYLYNTRLVGDTKEDGEYVGRVMKGNSVERVGVWTNFLKYWDGTKWVRKDEYDAFLAKQTTELETKEDGSGEVVEDGSSEVVEDGSGDGSAYSNEDLKSYSQFGFDWKPSSSLYSLNYSDVKPEDFSNQVLESNDASEVDPLAKYMRGEGTVLGKDTRITKHLKASGFTEKRLAKLRMKNEEYQNAKRDRELMKAYREKYGYR